jgi:hypothetical protein
LITLKAFSYFSPILRIPIHPLCGFIEEFGQEGVVRDPDLVENYGSPKLSDLPVGFGGRNGTDFLFPLRAKPVLSLQQLKAEVFDSVLANLGLFPRDFVSCLP